MLLPHPLFAQSGIGTPSVNRPPYAQPISAVLVPPTTTYTVHATDQDGDTLTYAWVGDISCGIFAGSDGPSASWTHADGPPPSGCPHDQGVSHPGEIYVTVSDGKSVTVCSFLGSEPGGEGPCIISAAPPRAHYTSGWSWWDDVIRDYDYAMECIYYWLPLVLVMILIGMYLYKNGLFVGRKTEDDPCAKERSNEAALRAQYEAAKSAFQGINNTRNRGSDAAQHARDANKAAANAANAAGGHWSAHGSTDWEGEHIEVHKEGWQNKELGAKADAAEAAAHAAQASAKAAKDAYEALGGDVQWQELKSGMEAAKTAWEAADAALRACIGGICAPKSADSKTEASKPETAKLTDAGGGPSEGGGTPVVATPPPAVAPPKKEEPPSRVCVEGEERNVHTEQVTVHILDLSSVRLMQDKIYSDAGNEAMKFVDYLQTIKDVFMAGKQMKGGVDTYLESSLTGASDAVNFPDFLTWYDVGIDELTKSMHKLFAIMQDKQRLGDYWLEYQTKQVTLTCTSREVCAGNAWVKRCSLDIVDAGMTPHRTDPMSAHDVREVEPAIRRLFTQLRNRYKGDQIRAKDFTEKCHTCR